MTWILKESHLETRQRAGINVCCCVFFHLLPLIKTNMAGKGKSPCLIGNTSSFMVGSFHCHVRDIGGVYASCYFQ